MRIAYFDCFSGISGDMTLGALVDTGVDMAVLQAELAKLPVTGYRLEARVVKRGGLRGTKVDVLVEAAQPARKYTDIVAMITASDLSPAIRQHALDIFRRLGEAEAHLHHEPLDNVHFHEVGAVDAIVDVVGAAIGLQALEVAAIMASPVNVGSGTVRTAHGLLPVPAPATLELLKGCPSYASNIRLRADHTDRGGHSDDAGYALWHLALDAGGTGRLRGRDERSAECPKSPPPHCWDGRRTGER